jgi:acetyl-CoA carboxylase alpha subunit
MAMLETPIVAIVIGEGGSAARLRWEWATAC